MDQKTDENVKNDEVMTITKFKEITFIASVTVLVDH